MAPRWWGRGLAAAGVIAAALLLPDLSRAGYSPDEEFTRFAMRGIHAHGLPLLPSGLLYDRGLLYSYASAWASAGAPDSLLPARLVSMASALAALALLFAEVRRIAGAGAAALAAALAAASLPFWVSATTARFYAPFLLGYLAVLAVLARGSIAWPRLALLALLAAATRWTHELAFTLVAVPAVLAFLTGGGDRRAWIVRAAAVGAGLAAGQAALLAVHALAPPSNGDVMVRRFLVWQVLNLFERPPLDLPAALPLAAVSGAAVALGLASLRARVDLPAAAVIVVGGVAAALGQAAVAPVLVLAALPLRPATARRLVPVSVAIAAAGLGFWTLALTAAGQPAGDAWRRTLESGTAYPLDMFAHLAHETPLLAALALAGLLARAAGRGGAWPPAERALHALWIAWVLWFGVIESGITARYLLLPVTFALAAIAVDAAAIVARHGARRLSGAAPVLGLVLGVALTAESWGGVPPHTARAGAARPTLAFEPLRAELQPDDLVAAVDELGAYEVAGRLDAWLALDEFFRERFIVMRAAGATGTYTGAPAAFALRPLLERATREGRRLMVVDVLKEVPGFGGTAILVPRQLAREGLRADVVAEAPGARLLHVVEGGVEVVAMGPPALGRR